MSEEILRNYTGCGEREERVKNDSQIFAQVTEQMTEKLTEKEISEEGIVQTEGNDDKKKGTLVCLWKFYVEMKG